MTDEELQKREGELKQQIESAQMELLRLRYVGKCFGGTRGNQVVWRICKVYSNGGLLTISVTDHNIQMAVENSIFFSESNGKKKIDESVFLPSSIGWWQSSCP